ncbi:hypothetical protein M0R45_019757 [Rubus argutus]|uniref:Uncharacterized protein n=1 Tax=Rubus argutus TaxID=59490 RepID=A0AAW1X9T4_RUBAR
MVLGLALNCDEEHGLDGGAVRPVMMRIDELNGVAGLEIWIAESWVAWNLTRQWCLVKLTVGERLGDWERRERDGIEQREMGMVVIVRSIAEKL